MRSRRPPASRGKGILPWAVAVVAAVLAATPAAATFSGSNGRIAFEHITGDGPPQIATITPRGTHPRILTDFRNGAFGPAWSPNGGRIAFTRSSAAGDLLTTMRAGGAGLKRITRGCAGRCLADLGPAWSPDGRQIAFSRAYGPVVDDIADHIDLMVVDRNGTDRRVILRGRALRRRGLEAQTSSWSPDGEYLALNVYDLTDPDFPSAIYTLEIDSGDLRRLTPWHLNAADPDWSPDGTRILFNSNVCCKEHSSMYTMDPEGGAKRRLTDPAKRFTFEGSFSPSGNQIVYSVAGPGVILHLARMTLGGETHKRVTRPAFRGVEAAWGAGP